MFVRKLKSEVR